MLAPKIPLRHCSSKLSREKLAQRVDLAGAARAGGSAAALRPCVQLGKQ